MASNSVRECIADRARGCAPSLSLTKVHIIAGTLQLVSAVTFLIIYFTQNTKPEATTSLYLHYTGWANVSEDTSCEVVKCRAVDDSHRLPVNILALVVVFTAWSGICHFVTVMFGPGFDNGGYGRFFRAVDYAVSAPLMLIVVSVTCGVNDFGQIINSMAVMSLVVVVDYIADLIDHATGSGTEWSRKLFWPNCTAYIAYWAVLWAAFGYAAKGGPGRASAPIFVYFVVFGTMLTFSSFAFLRGYTLWPEKLTPVLSKLCCCMRPLCRDDCCADDTVAYDLTVTTFPRTEALYAVLSLVAKTQLSWFLFIGVLQDMTTEDNEVKPQTDDEELESSLAVLFATLTVGFAMAVVVVKYIEDGTMSTQTFDRGLSPRRQLMG